ncbi:Spherulation-specific family 4 [filamentous cyanobacterium CCP5]|nr:Spherulation-specific family 4 [filamentous cyanobacterium CCP5]
MRKIILSSLTILVMSTAGGCQASGYPSLEVLIPLYIYPSHYNPETYVWPTVAAAQGQVDITAIINPNNGPNGGAPNRDYVQGMQILKAAGVEMMGYVSTRYGERPIAEVKAEIDIYASFYPVSGIFLDEAATSIDKIEYYQQLYQHIRTHFPLQQTILNHGTSPDPAYLSQSTGDTFVIFENDAFAWRTHPFPTYLTEANTKQFAAMVHTCSNIEAMREIIAQARNHNIGYVFVTDDRMDGGDQNPWNQLPSYWGEEIDVIRSLNVTLNEPPQ